MPRLKFPSTEIVANRVLCDPSKQSRRVKHGSPRAPSENDIISPKGGEKVPLQLGFRLARSRSMVWLMTTLPMIAHGATVTVTLTGHVYKATDGYGNLFVATGTSTPLDNQPFTLVFTLDNSLATPLIYSCGGMPEYSQSSGTDISPTALLTIGGRSFTVGGGGMGQTSGSWYALQYAAIPCSSYPDGAASYNVSAIYGSGGYTGTSRITDLAIDGVSVFPAPGGSFSADYEWWSFLSSTATDSSPQRAFGFYIIYAYSSGNQAGSYNQQLVLVTSGTSMSAAIFLPKL